MMRLGLLFTCLAGLLLVACGTAQPAPTPTEITQAQVTNTPVLPTVTATALSTTNTNMPTETTMPATNTPTPFPTTTTTPPPTAAPTITPTPLPPPPGEIYFFLDPDPFPDDGSFDQRPPKTYDFYRATPGTLANEWRIEALWSEITLAGQFIIISPDKIRIALLLLEDTNGDGQLNDAPGEDIRNIYVYDRSGNSIKPLTNNQYNSFSASWQPDSQTITYSQRPDILNITINETLPELLLTVSGNSVGQLSWSPNGQLLVFHTNAQQLYAYHSDTKELELVSDSEAALDFIGSAWSPDSHWLAYMQFANYGLELTRRLYVMDSEILTTVLLNSDGDVVSKPVWSTDSSYLAFTRNESALSLWHTGTLTFTTILTSQKTSPPVWAPTVAQVALGTMEGNITQLLIIDVISGDVQTVYESTEFQIIKPYSWSPDGEWILFYANKDDQSGLYVVHLSSRTVYQVLDTSGGNYPLELVWLPTLQSTSD